MQPLSQYVVKVCQQPLATGRQAIKPVLLHRGSGHHNGIDGASTLGVGAVHLDATGLIARIDHGGGAARHQEILLNLDAHTAVRVNSISGVGTLGTVCLDVDLQLAIVGTDGHVAIGLYSARAVTVGQDADIAARDEHVACIVLDALVVLVGDDGIDGASLDEYLAVLFLVRVGSALVGQQHGLHLDTVAGGVLVDGDIAAAHEQVLSHMDGITDRLLDDDVAGGLLQLQILLASEGMSGVAAHCERAATLYLHVSLAVEGALVEPSGSIRKRFWFGSWGKLDVTARAGAQWNTVPFPLLNLPMANLSYITQNNESFNLIDNMEFLNDRYASLALSYDMNGKLFNRIPLIKKLKWREMFRIRGMWGTLTDKNNPYKSSNPDLFLFPMRDGVPTSHVMGKTPYIEASVGIYNIFKLLHIEYVRRLTYTDIPGVKKGGVRFMILMIF